MRRMDEGRIGDRGKGPGTPDDEMVRSRAREIAVINGRSEKNVLDSDLDQAKRELQGDEKLAPQQSGAESVPEGQRWNPIPGSTGKRAPTVPAADEQTVTEKLVEEGVADAEHDQHVEATREDLRREKRP